jgi:hypothetical protein
MIRLRPHHLLCMLTYAGRGYTPRFTSGMDDLTHRLGSGEEITLIDGPDDICAPWIEEAQTAEAKMGEAAGATNIRAPHCHEARITGRDQRAAADIAQLLGRDLASGSRLRLDADLLNRLRNAYRADTIRSGCVGCEWKDFCDSLSASDFAGCRLQVASA